VPIKINLAFNQFRANARFSISKTQLQKAHLAGVNSFPCEVRFPSGGKIKAERS